MRVNNPSLLNGKRHSIFDSMIGASQGLSIYTVSKASFFSLITNWSLVSFAAVFRLVTSRNPPPHKRPFVGRRVA